MVPPTPAGSTCCEDEVCPVDTPDEAPSRPLSSASTGRPSLKARALRYLAAREHSRWELTRKLAPHAQSPESLDAVLDALEAAGWLSMTRFAQSVVHRRASRFGLERVRRELQQHGVEATVVAAAVDPLHETEFERARALWVRRYGEVADTPADRQRQDRFLRQRGFSSDVIRRVLRGEVSED